MKTNFCFYSQLNYSHPRTAIEAESVVLHFVFFIVIVNKMQQSAKEGRSRSNKNILFEVFPLTIGSGKTMPFEKRHVGCEEREKINRRRIYDTLRINFFEATKQTACIFSTGDKNNPQDLRVHKHIFVGNSRLVTAMTHTDNNGDNAEQREKRYYYHSDHLGSAQFVTDWRGKQYEHIEYTPYGELWIEEVAAGLDKLPFRFTGKEMDEETGLYYYGARYLDPKYSRWLSGDPALSDYIPKAPIDDEAKKHNENLPGMGGVYNIVNMHLYHYAGNNPVKYTDPDGKDIISFFKGWVNYNLNNTIFSRYGSQYAYNPQFEMANEVLANIGQIMKNGYSVYVQTLKFTSEHSGTATLFLLTIGQPGLAAITSTIGLAADSLLVIDNFANGNIVEGSKGIAVIGLSMLANNGVKKGFEKLGSLVGISVGKNGLYYMKGRRGALKTIDGIRKQLYKDLVEGYFGQAIAPEVASQMVDAVMKEILKTEKVEE